MGLAPERVRDIEFLLTIEPEDEAFAGCRSEETPVVVFEPMED